MIVVSKLAEWKTSILSQFIAAASSQMLPVIELHIPGPSKLPRQFDSNLHSQVGISCCKTCRYKKLMRKKHLQTIADYQLGILEAITLSDNVDGVYLQLVVIKHYTLLQIVACILVSILLKTERQVLYRKRLVNWVHIRHSLPADGINCVLDLLDSMWLNLPQILHPSIRKT